MNQDQEPTHSMPDPSRTPLDDGSGFTDSDIEHRIAAAILGDGGEFFAPDGDTPQPPRSESEPQPSPPPFPEFAPQPLQGDDELTATLAECAELDQSDTSNGKRLISYFGKDIVVMEAAEIPGGAFLTWTGTHWDIAGGAAGASLIAQSVGDMIMLEADHMARTPLEERQIDAGKKAEAELKNIDQSGDLTAAQVDQVEALEALINIATKAKAALSLRKRKRRDFAVSSKNGGRLKQMLDLASPRLRKPIDQFNADVMLTVTRSHSIRFIKEQIDDPDCPDPDVVRKVTRSRVEIAADHRRQDFVTGIVPVDYDPDAKASKWRSFIERMLPAADVRRTVQQFTGLSLLGIPVQLFMFHYGEGANGKSVFLETMVRLLGKSYAVGLPTESIIGTGDRNAGGASPDIFRLFGKRMVRVLELPEGKELQSELIKKLTGGEDIPVRTLYKGFIDFQPRAKPHMSGNGQPKITDTSNGLWRRMLFINWPVVLARNEQRDFEEVVSELVAEGSGILNWLIEGALDFLENDLFIADSVRADTKEYQEDSNIILQFFRDCVERAEGESVQARAMYIAFKEWCAANAKAVLFETKFGRDMKRQCKRDDTGRVRMYVNVKLRADRPRDQRSDRVPHPAENDEAIP